MLPHCWYNARGGEPILVSGRWTQGYRQYSPDGNESKAIAYHNEPYECGMLRSCAAWALVLALAQMTVTSRISRPPKPRLSRLPGATCRSQDHWSPSPGRPAVALLESARDEGLELSARKYSSRCCCNRYFENERGDTRDYYRCRAECGSNHSPRT